MVELVDTHVSGACVARHEGSSPSFGTLSGAGSQELGPGGVKSNSNSVLNVARLLIPVAGALDQISSAYLR